MSRDGAWYKWSRQWTKGLGTAFMIMMASPAALSLGRLLPIAGQDDL